MENNKCRHQLEHAGIALHPSELLPQFWGSFLTPTAYWLSRYPLGDSAGDLSSLESAEAVKLFLGG